MHPKWQEKVLQYYRNLFIKDGKQIAQLLIATHSEYLLRSALSDKDNVLIVALNENGGQIVGKRIMVPSVLPAITSAETNYIAFGIISNDYHIELYGYLQNKTNCNTVKSCDDYITRQSSYNTTKHAKPSSHQTTHYQTLPTYIRNAIDHPDTSRTFTSAELECSIELLISLCK
jgi:hypothetical protein